MEERTKQDLMQVAVAGGIGAGCLAVSPSLGDMLMTYGKEIAEVVAIIAQGFGAGALAVAGIKLVPYIAKWIKKSIGSKRKNDVAKINQPENNKANTKQKTSTAVRTGELNRGLTNASKRPSSNTQGRKSPHTPPTVTPVATQNGLRDDY